MIKLKKVSKYYYSKGIIASGLTNVSLELNFGEFVVITGESGSGKTTLLNVISGLDSYEEGELYIDGVETSHYTSSDFEDYRKKYIGNIFQEFNLVNSYTVYQNIELVLLINGNKKSNIKEKVNSIIAKVGLEEYTNTKCSKLSGGQKQRVAIARALAKETPIIVADEPTGNLDSKSAAGIITLLREISKDKLVIVVTHNYEQFENYATRVIKMADGKITEDKKIKEYEEQPFTPNTSSHQILKGSQLRLGLRNTFNVIPKFLLLLLVFAFVVVSVAGSYTSFKYQEDERDQFGYNEFFQNYTEDRIVIKKEDNSVISEEDFEKLKKVPNIKTIEKNDMVVDNPLYVDNDAFYFDGFPVAAESFKGKVDHGKVPTEKGEVLLAMDKESFYTDDVEAHLDKEYTFDLMNDGSQIKGKVVGIQFIDISENNWYGKIYLAEDLVNRVKENTYRSFSNTSVTINDKNYSSETGMYQITPSSKVPKGEAYVSEEVNYLFKSENAINHKIDISIENIYFKDNMTLTMAKTYKKSNFEKLTGFKDYESHEGEVFINSAQYNSLFEKGYYQSSVFVKDIKIMDETLKELKTLGYKPLALKDHLEDYGDSEILSIIQVPFLIIFIIAIFFIAYFVTRLILKSRGGYFSTVRMLGLAKKNIMRIMDIELCTVVSIAYALFLGLITLLKQDIITIEYMQSIIDYFRVSDYVILYAILLFMAFLISRRFAKKIFKKSAMVTFREEA